MLSKTRKGSLTNKSYIYVRPTNDLEQQLKRFARRVFDFDIEILKKPCTLAVVPTLFTKLEKLRDDEVKLIDLLEEKKCLDEAWEDFEPTITYNSNPNINKRKRKYNEMYEEEGKKDFEIIEAREKKQKRGQVEALDNLLTSTPWKGYQSVSDIVARWMSLNKIVFVDIGEKSTDVDDDVFVTSGNTEDKEHVVKSRIRDYFKSHFKHRVEEQSYKFCLI